MTTTWNDLAQYLKVADRPEQEAAVQQDHALAVQLVTDFVGSSVVPEVVLDKSVLLAGAELFNARSTKNGISQYKDADGTPLRIARDPLVAVYPLLKKYVVQW